MVREKAVERKKMQKRKNICIMGVPGEEETKLRFKTIKQENFQEIEKDLN